MSTAVREAGHGVAWKKGGSADLVAIDDDLVVLRSTIPAPPGARLDGRLGGDEGPEIRVKVHGSKRESEGVFTLRGRLIDANRELRERLARAVTPASTDGST